MSDDAAAVCVSVNSQQSRVSSALLLSTHNACHCLVVQGAFATSLLCCCCNCLSLLCSGSLSFDIEKSDPSFYSGSLQRSSTTDATVKHSGAHAGESAPNPRPVQGSLRRDDTAANHCAGLIDQKAAAAIARSGSSLQHSTSLWPRSGQEQQQQQPRLTPGMLQQAQQQQRQQLQTPFSNSGAYSGISHCPASTASSGPAAGNAARLGEWSSDSSEE